MRICGALCAKKLEILGKSTRCDTSVMASVSTMSDLDGSKCRLKLLMLSTLLITSLTSGKICLPVRLESFHFRPVKITDHQNVGEF